MGNFLREFAEQHSGVSLACMVAADRYEHIINEIMPALGEGKIVISDRYILSSLILQEMDGVGTEFILNTNSEIIKPDLVKCLPLTEEQKLRYPNKKEIDSCYEHLAEEIQELSPKIVFLLGGKVSSAVEKHLKINFEKWDEFKYHYKKINGVYYVPIHHPSYIYVYRRKRIDEYINEVERIIKRLL